MRLGRSNSVTAANCLRTKSIQIGLTGTFQPLNGVD